MTLSFNPQGTVRHSFPGGVEGVGVVGSVKFGRRIGGTGLVGVVETLEIPRKRGRVNAFDLHRWRDVGVRHVDGPLNNSVRQRRAEEVTTAGLGRQRIASDGGLPGLHVDDKVRTTKRCDEERGVAARSGERIAALRTALGHGERRVERTVSGDFHCLAEHANAARIFNGERQLVHRFGKRA